LLLLLLLLLDQDQFLSATEDEDVGLEYMPGHLICCTVLLYSPVDLASYLGHTENPDDDDDDDDDD